MITILGPKGNRKNGHIMASSDGSGYAGWPHWPGPLHVLNRSKHSGVIDPLEELCSHETFGFIRIAGTEAVFVLIARFA